MLPKSYMDIIIQKKDKIGVEPSLVTLQHSLTFKLKLFCFFFSRKKNKTGYAMQVKKKRTVKYTVRFTEDENAIFLKHTNNALISSKAEYLRKIALNEIILSKTDNDNFREFLKVAGQQGKLIGLLRIYLMEYETNDKTNTFILSSINELMELKEQLKILSDKIL